jgi:hypothetical protein
MHHFGPVEVEFLRDLVACGYTSPDTIASMSEASLYRHVVAAALCISEPVAAAPLDANEARRLARVAEAVDAASGSRWWSAPWWSRPQIWLSGEHEPPRPEPSLPPARGKPPAVLWTSSAVDGLPCAFWPVVESGVLAGPRTWWAWRLEFDEAPMVLEIDSVEDWRRLCDQYPGAEGGPAWRDVSKDFDAVHLTTRGLLRNQGRTVETSHGPAVLLGWDAESTGWFRWRVTSAVSLGQVETNRVGTWPSVGR